MPGRRQNAWQDRGAAWAEECMGAYACKGGCSRVGAARALLGQAGFSVRGLRLCLQAQHRQALDDAGWGALQSGCAPGMDREVEAEAIGEMQAGYEDRLREIAAGEELAEETDHDASRT